MIVKGYEVKFPECLDSVAIESLDLANYIETLRTTIDELAMCAYYLDGVDQLCLTNIVNVGLGISIREYNPEFTYEKLLAELVDTVGGYNDYVERHSLPYPQLILIVDDEASACLTKNGEYKVYSVVT